MRVLWAVLWFAWAVAGLDVKFVVVEMEPATALAVVAGVRAGLGTAQARAQDTQDRKAAAAMAEGGRRMGRGDEEDEEDEVTETVEPRAVEYGELLDVPAQVCGAAADNHVYAVVTGVGPGVELSAAAAARAGLPLLLVGGVEAAHAHWEALAMYPRADVALQAARDLIQEKSWRHAALLHAGSARPAALLAPDTDELQLVVRQLPPEEEDALLRDMLLVLKKAGYVNFIVWSSAERGVRVLDAAQRVGLLAAKHSYILLAFELHTQDLEPLSHGGANITGLMFFDPEANETKDAVEAWNTAYAEHLSSSQEEVEPVSFTPRNIPSAFLLAHDAALVASFALRSLMLPEQAPGDCATGVGAFHADTLLNYLRSEEPSLIGATGIMSWESDGWRRHIILQVMELQRGGELEVVGSWRESEGMMWRRRPQPAKPLPTETMANRTFRVLIAMNKPYVMAKESTDRLSGNARYEGFCIELIEKLAEMLHFNYTFEEQTDGIYGGQNKKTGEWEGMLRKVMDDKENLTLAITDLTITEEREKVVDFTTPFMNLGIAILFKKPKTPEPELFAFLLPFSTGVWLCLGLAYVGTSLVLYCVGRLCPEEWQNPYPCIEEPDALENQFTLGNALWFNLGAVLLQGSEIAPVGYSTRAVAGVWWLFALVITSSYTANLATLLAQKSSNDAFKNVEELARNDQGITFGAKGTGSTYIFFEHSQGDLFKEMYEVMKKQKMPKDNDEGIRWVMDEEKDFAFLMESTTIEYVVERNCKVKMVGDLLDSKGYGIAMAKSSPYRQELNLALLRLQEKGELREMKRSWWEERNGGGACKEEEERESSELEMNSFYGLFLVLVVGCLVGVLLSCGDLAWHTSHNPRHPDLPFFANFAEELRFVFKFDQSAKPVTGPLIVEKTPSERTSLETAEEEAGGECEQDGEMEAVEEADRDRDIARCESAQSGPRRRRRSSMHAASMKLARHAHGRDSLAQAR